MRPSQIPVRNLAGGADTIAALATPPGRGAISVVRLSGPHVHQIASSLITPWPLEPRCVTLCRISDPLHGDVLDQALVTSFIAPHSFTGEDLVEISGHGGNYVPALLMKALISNGARQALPGEFTRRAVLNGKLDITQAEAIGDLVDARSEAMHRIALSQLDGGLFRRVSTLRSSLISVESLIAYDIDFPEEDDGPVPRSRIAAESDTIIRCLDDLLSTIPVGHLVREGAVVVIAGVPNVGKSSLFNALLGQSRSIVTDIPGTTRDAIEGFLETENWPVRLVDTAGLRHSGDTVEQIGVEISEKYVGNANVVLGCGDSEETLAAVQAAIREKTTAPVVIVRTKADLMDATANARAKGMADVTVSVETGEGLRALVDRVDRILSDSVGHTVTEIPVLTRTRQVLGVQEARNELQAFREAWITQSLPAPVAAVHLRAATVALESLIGAVSTEEVLDRVFSSFCVGK